MLSSFQSHLSGSSILTKARLAPNPLHQAYLVEPISIASPSHSSQSPALVATPSTVYDPLWDPDSGASNHLTTNPLILVCSIPIRDLIAFKLAMSQV